jgi:hypothetical protein
MHNKVSSNLNRMNRRNTPFTLKEAAEEAPTLASLMRASRESNERLQSIQFLIPTKLRSVIFAGPVDGASWCLLVDGNAAMSKVRQLIPVFQAHLASTGVPSLEIRLKLRLAQNR